jgi:hypothetical protein
MEHRVASCLKDKEAHMAHFWINQGVAGAQEQQVHAHSYVMEGQYVHFLDESKQKVLSIRQEITFLIERSDA